MYSRQYTISINVIPAKQYTTIDHHHAIGVVEVLLAPMVLINLKLVRLILRYRRKILCLFFFIS